MCLYQVCGAKSGSAPGYQGHGQLSTDTTKVSDVGPLGPLVFVCSGFLVWFCYNIISRGRKRWLLYLDSVPVFMPSLVYVLEHVNYI